MTRSARSLLAVGSVAAAVAAAAGAGMSGAAFQASSPDLAVTFDAGTLALTSSRDGLIVVAADGMRPGNTRQGIVTTSNAGDVSGTLRFDVEGPPADVPASPPLSAVVTIQVEECTSASLSCPGAVTVLSQRTLATAASDPATVLGSIAAGAQRHHRLTVAWSALQDSPAYQGAATSVTAAFGAEAGS